ncbi:Required for excision 1-B domain-containing protein [Dillenia turbinata]|uniref:Required for excision 1-B domain-containing protein n=1 Tax=Dillenia turbinata TaxID=194707 RepID=A0AAN8ZDS4_9MAGN
MEVMEETEKAAPASEGEAMEIDSNQNETTSRIVDLLRKFLGIQQRRAEAYSKLRSNEIEEGCLFCRGFADYMVSGGDLAYQQLCSEITVEFNDCSKQVLEIESLFLNPDFCRDDLARLLRAVQVQEKEKLHLINNPILLFDYEFYFIQDTQESSLDCFPIRCMGFPLTATIQVLKKAGRPSERLVSHENCKFKKPMGHECVHVHEITEAAGTEEAEADAEYDNALKEAIRGVQDAVTAINEHMEEVRYEIAALEAE